MASRRGHLDILKYLLKRGSSPNSQVQVTWTYCTQVPAQQGASPNSEVQVTWTYSSTCSIGRAHPAHRYWSPGHTQVPAQEGGLTQLTGTGHVDILKYLLKRGSSPNSQVQVTWTYCTQVPAQQGASPNSEVQVTWTYSSTCSIGRAHPAHRYWSPGHTQVPAQEGGLTQLTGTGWS